jgi:hypothetical protein
VETKQAPSPSPTMTINNGQPSGCLPYLLQGPYFSYLSPPAKKENEKKSFTVVYHVLRDQALALPKPRGRIVVVSFTTSCDLKYNYVDRPKTSAGILKFLEPRIQWERSAGA